MDYSVPSLACHALEKYLGEDEARVHVLRGVSLAVRTGVQLTSSVAFNCRG